jgi:hypothetical protein
MIETVIHLEAVTRVFVTDEIETHALAGIDLDRSIHLFDGRIVDRPPADSGGMSGERPLATARERNASAVAYKNPLDYRGYLIYE